MLITYICFPFFQIFYCTFFVKKSYFFYRTAITSGRKTVKLFERFGKMKPVRIAACSRDFVNGFIGINQLSPGIFHADVQEISSGSHPHFLAENFIKLVPAHACFSAEISIGKWFLQIVIDAFHSFPDPRAHDLFFRFQKILFRDFREIKIDHSPQEQGAPVLIGTVQDLFHLRFDSSGSKGKNGPSDSVERFRSHEMQIELAEFPGAVGGKFCVRRDQDAGVFFQIDPFSVTYQLRAGVRVPVEDPAGENRLRINPIIHIGKTTFDHCDIKGFPGIRGNDKKRMI